MTVLSTQLRDILDAVAAQLTTTPDRVYVANGRPPFDSCAQLTIHVAGFHVGTPPLERPDRSCAPTTVTAVLTQTWCIPTMLEDGNPPSEAKLNASGVEVVDGANALWVASRAAMSSVVSCRPSIIGAEPVEPSGGYVGWTVIVSWVP